jgi:hypothetical protein
MGMLKYICNPFRRLYIKNETGRKKGLISGRDMSIFIIPSEKGCPGESGEAR